MSQERVIPGKYGMADLMLILNEAELTQKLYHNIKPKISLNQNNTERRLKTP